MLECQTKQVNFMPYVTWLNPGEGVEYPVRFKTRLRAWWEGYDLSVLKPVEGNEAAAAAELMAATLASSTEETEDTAELRGINGKPLWNAERIKVAETLWGGDFISPGGVEHTTYLVKPFGITSAMSILDLSAGLGGVARTIAMEYKAWVTGMEASPLLAKIGNERSTKLGMTKNAPVEAYDPEKLNLTRRYDGIFAKEAFFTVQNKDKLFDAINKGLKPGGQFLFTDYCTLSETTSPVLSKWLAAEPLPPNLWTVEKLIAALRLRKLDVRTNEDITELQRKLILRALGHFLEHLESHKLDLSTKRAVLEEVELWARRMAAFDAGLRVYRFYCMKR
jgi:cyclopropane fatty-acyl-phospholipid synthase-like methyltransferase